VLAAQEAEAHSESTDRSEGQLLLALWHEVPQGLCPRADREAPAIASQSRRLNGKMERSGGYAERLGG
jgi:hypothetical protein